MILSKLDHTIPVAYLSIRGATILIVFPDPANQPVTYAALQAAAASQGFQCDVAAVWEDSRGRTRFIAPPQQHPFFEVANYGQLRAQTNGSIEV
jgi:hypothetical protein